MVVDHGNAPYLQWLSGASWFGEGGEGARQERARTVREQKRVEGEPEREEGSRRERTKEG
jgi:hypothetical protein